MRIATWNMESQRRLTPQREAAFQKSMAEVNADVWVLTETWRTFSPGAGYQLLSQSQQAADLNRRSDRCWVSLWGKLSLLGVSQETQNQPDRLAGCRIVMSNQQNLVVVGTVLPWNSDRLWPGERGFFASLGFQTEEWETQRKGWSRSTLVVAGDFNQSIPHERWYGSRKRAEALNNAFQKLDVQCLTQGKCELTGHPRIDHICISRSSLDLHHLPPIGDWIIPSINDEPVTDHSGVYVDWETRSSP